MRVVIKVGTSTLTHANGNLNIRRFEDMCKVIADLKNAGNEIILVSSGAIGLGVGKLALKEKPSDIPTKQAAAAVGQCELMYIYDQQFSRYNHTVAQILLTSEDFDDPVRHTNLSNTLSRLLEMKVMPIINENDTVATSEIKVGDNDTLSAVTAVSAKADILILMSDIEGLYTADPHKDPDAKLISLVEDINDDIKALAGGVGSALGTGGMRTKLNAAELCVNNGISMLILNGSNPALLYDVFDGKPVGTLFRRKKNK